ncbi:uncharacterized protein MKK02DRAFT_33320 [Dioszegia hungarica]|uniref:ditrans,polycis-polyprenyl diphosphate synthase [(2E,6E)-farnesyldiphosphate specific] n=1 Tax=Dioszegia hungarica TaxID=4972 RepID=A0AA38LVW0_9TREE|nr:uncharacterized protein MKK02DRAFT_33320 [Dioszegia hungarica]KAI9636029.1 hypothetical protein MKK02DRAFT_33320 [Dioszegia hungarica]
MSPSLRARDIPALPFLTLLHVFFTLSSLFLRTYELLTNPETDLDHDELSSSSSTRSPARRELSSPPKHIGMVILAPSRPRHTSRGRTSATTWNAKEKSRVVECVLNLVELAAEEGVVELSVYERSGLLASAKDEIMAELLYLPLSPPASEPRTSSGFGTPGEELHEVDDRVGKAMGSSGGTDQVTTLTVFPSSNYHAGATDSASKTRRLTIHLIPPSASEVVATVTNNLVKTSVRAEDITPSMLDEGVRAALHFSRDPDLLIVHTLVEPVGWKSWLPRPAPELGGYPFWTLRISEIYHHPPPLPLLSLFKPLLHLARTSTLPFLRKLGKLVPSPPHIRNEMLDLYEGDGRIGREEWEGAMRAWRAVEQRLGR